MPADVESAQIFIDLGRISDETIVALTGVSQAAIDSMRAGNIPPADPQPVQDSAPDPDREPKSEFEPESLPEESCADFPPTAAPGLQSGVAGGAGSPLPSAPSVSFSLCHFPVGEVGEADFHFCAEPVKQGSPYCAEHHARCHTKFYTPAERKRWRSGRGRLTSTTRADTYGLNV